MHGFSAASSRSRRPPGNLSADPQCPGPRLQPEDQPRSGDEPHARPGRPEPAPARGARPGQAGDGQPRRPLGAHPGQGLELVAPQVALLGLLFLRGPQTLNELLTRSNRLHDFDDVEQIRHHLERLAGRGLAVHLERRAGQREERYMHLLGSQADLEGRRGGDGQRPGTRRAGRSVGRCGSADRRAGDAPGGAGGAPGQARRRGVISREGAIGDMQVPADNRERLFALRPAVTLWAALPVG